MITKEQALAMTHAQVFYGAVSVYGKGSDKRPRRVRVSGKCQTWKTRPAEFRLPFKYGLYKSGSLTEANAGQFFLTEEEAFNA